jgi:TetR/AcrR family transcriptional regulator, copper-responsive repressor
VLSASSDAITDPEIRALVADAIDNTDRTFGRLFADARAAGELPAGADPRARIPRAQILPLIDDAVRTICASKNG